MAYTSASVVAALVVGVVLAVAAKSGVGGRESDGPPAELAIEIGLDPVSLAVAGCTPSDVDVMLRELGAAGALAAQLGDARSTVETLVCDAGAIAEQLSAEPGNAEVRQAYASIVIALDHACARVSELRADLTSVAFEGVSRNRFVAWSVGRGGRGRAVPQAFRAVAHSESELLQLERFATLERRSQRRGRPVHPEAAQRLADMRARYAIVDAQESLAVHLEAIETRFERQ